jgi:hypothetical protein
MIYYYFDLIELDLILSVIEETTNDKELGSESK